MKVLVATPAYGSQVTLPYLSSLLDTVTALTNSDIDIKVKTLGNEALINRARNTLCYYARKKGYDKIFFIDADLSWSLDDFKRIVLSDKPVIGGTYPLKTLPISLNYNPLPHHYLMHFKEIGRTPEQTVKFGEAEGNANNEVEVLHLPTGFMCIDIKVLDTLTEHVDAYKNDVLGAPDETHHEFFATGVKNGTLESEDWNFCRVCRAHDISVWMNYTVIADHTGPFTFSPDQALSGSWREQAEALNNSKTSK